MKNTAKNLEKVASKKSKEAEELFRQLGIHTHSSDDYEPLAIYSGATVRRDQPILFGRLSPNSTPFLVIE